MSPVADGWSVDVQGTTVVVTFPPSDEMGRRSLTVDEARVLCEQLGFAHLLAGRNRATGTRTLMTSMRIEPLAVG